MIEDIKKLAIQKKIEGRKSKIKIIDFYQKTIRNSNEIDKKLKYIDLLC